MLHALIERRGCRAGHIMMVVLGVLLWAGTGCASRFYHAGPVPAEGDATASADASAPANSSNSNSTPPRASQPRSSNARPVRANATDQPAQNNDVGVRFSGPGSALSAPSTEMSPETRPELTRHVDTREAGLNTLGLFGQFNASLETPRTTPFDGANNLMRVTYTEEGADFDPAVAPDGNTLVYASTRHRQTEDLYSKSVDGRTITQLTDDPARDVMPTFSPDGKRLAFASDRSGSWDIYVMDADGGQVVQLTDDQRQNIHPSFSPDGNRLVYSSYGGTARRWQMVVVSLDEPGTKRFIGPGLFPSWSPTSADGDRILFQRARQRGTRWFSIWTVTLNDSGEASAPTEIVASTNAAIITPAWGPKGEHIVFCTVAHPGADEQHQGGGAPPARADVWVVRTDGTGRARLTGGAFANLQPTWASDGTIYFVSDRGGRTENIWAVRADQAMRLAEPGNGGDDGDTAGTDASAMAPASTDQ